LFIFVFFLITNMSAFRRLASKLSTLALYGTSALFLTHGVLAKADEARAKSSLKNQERDSRLLRHLAGSESEQQIQSQRPHAVVIGAGVAGVCTAYELARRGYAVDILEKSIKGPGSECSAVSAGGCQRMNVPMNADMWKSVFLSAFDKHRTFFLKGPAVFDPHFWRWGMSFTMASMFDNHTTHRHREQSMLDFTNWSIDALEQVLDREPEIADECGYTHSGAMKVYTSEAAVQNSVGKWSLPHTDDEPAVVLTKQQLLEHNPCMSHTQVELHGALLQTQAARANSEPFTKMLAQVCERELGVTVHRGVSIIGFEQDRETSRISEIITNQGVMSIDENTNIVVAAGSWTPLILRRLGLFVPVYPLKGYSGAIHTPDLPASVRDDPASLPNTIVAVEHIYFSPLGKELRFAGIGELAGWDTTPDESIADALRQQAKRVMPHLESAVDAVEIRCGLRPFTSDGATMLGRVPQVSNLYVNTGPGFNGWKIGLGGGRALAMIIQHHDRIQAAATDTGDSNKASDEANIPGVGFDLAPLSPNGRIKKAPITCFFADAYARLMDWGESQ
jgi:D-amino-acid dehydrogenase